MKVCKFLLITLLWVGCSYGMNSGLTFSGENDRDLGQGIDILVGQLMPDRCALCHSLFGNWRENSIYFISHQAAGDTSNLAIHVVHKHCFDDIWAGDKKNCPVCHLPIRGNVLVKSSLRDQQSPWFDIFSRWYFYGCMVIVGSYVLVTGGPFLFHVLYRGYADLSLLDLIWGSLKTLCCPCTTFAAGYACNELYVDCLDFCDYCSGDIRAHME